MNILLLEPRVKAIAPNIALMKYANWCEYNGYNYRYVRGRIKEEWFKMEKFEPDKIYMSCIFSYYSERYEKTIEHYFDIFPLAEIVVGGVFPTLYQDWFESKDRSWNRRGGYNIFYKKHNQKLTVISRMAPEIEDIPPLYNVDIKSEDELYPRDKIVLYASRGCVNKCGYCAVPRLEGDMTHFRSIKDTLDIAEKDLTEKNLLTDKTSVVLYDNNFTEHKYFDDIIEELVNFGKPVDIHGLHVESFTEDQAKQFARLKWAAQGEHGTAYLRFSFDKVEYRPSVERAYKIYMDQKEPKIAAGFFCYMLFNWSDDPIDFWNRIVACQKIVNKYKKGRPIFLFPQRYEPFKPKSKDKKLQGLKRNQYISKKWSDFAGSWNKECSGDDLVRGITRMYTWVHGFLSVTRSENLFNWIGEDCNEFLNRVYAMSKKNSLKKIERKIKVNLNQIVKEDFLKK